MKQKIKVLALAIFVSIISCAVSARVLGTNLWWFGLPFSTAFLALAVLKVLPGIKILRQIPEDRLKLNLHVEGIQKTRSFYPVHLWAIILVGVFASSIIFVFKQDIEVGFSDIATVLRPDSVVLRVEYPSYTETPALEIKLSSENQKVSADTGSFFQIFSPQKSKNKLVKLLIQSDSIAASSREFEFTSAGNWAASVSSIYAQMQWPETEDHSFSLKITSQNSKTIIVPVEIKAVPRPLVNLAQVSALSEDSDIQTVGKLNFSIDVQSQIPLNQVEFQVRTRSGYRFTKTLGEFANGQQSTFRAPSAPLNTAGIPFGQKDALYVKVLARTVVPEIFGESKEIEIEVKSREEIRQQIIKELETAQSEIKNSKNSVDKQKANAQVALEKAYNAAVNLGRQSVTRRQIQAAKENVEKMKAPADANAKKAEIKIQAALDALKREQNQEQVSNLFSKLQSLKASIPNLNESEIPKLAADAQKLTTEAEGLKQKMLDATKSNSTGLNLDEKQAIEKILKFDKTPEKIADTSEKLKNNDRSGAEIQANFAVEEASKNLGEVMRIMAAARARALKEARENLTKADANLEQGREKEANQASENMSTAEQSLQNLPKLSKEFNEAGEDARENAKQASKSAQSGKTDGMRKSANQSQESIVKALEALQDEEESDKQNQQEQDGQSYRSAMDAMAAQGQLDMGWRKKILDEISRLRATGESADSPLIQYLESRLR